MLSTSFPAHGGDFLHTLLVRPVVLLQASVKSRIYIKVLNKLQSLTPEMSFSISS